MRDVGRSKREKFQGDVTYEVWRRGGNPDLIDRDDVADRMHYESPEEVASGIVERDRRSD
jgi:hypothetical protein